MFTDPLSSPVSLPQMNMEWRFTRSNGSLPLPAIYTDVRIGFLRTTVKMYYVWNPLGSIGFPFALFWNAPATRYPLASRSLPLSLETYRLHHQREKLNTKLPYRLRFQPGWCVLRYVWQSDFHNHSRMPEKQQKNLRISPLSAQKLSISKCSLLWTKRYVKNRTKSSASSVSTRTALNCTSSIWNSWFYQPLNNIFLNLTLLWWLRVSNPLQLSISSLKFEWIYNPTSKHFYSWLTICRRTIRAPGRKNIRISQAGIYTKPLIVQCTPNVIGDKPFSEVYNCYPALKITDVPKKPSSSLLEYVLPLPTICSRKTEPYNLEFYHKDDCPICTVWFPLIKSSLSSSDKAIL